MPSTCDPLTAKEWKELQTLVENETSSFNTLGKTLRLMHRALLTHSEDLLEAQEEITALREKANDE